jgi:hypothetical protein
VIICYCDSCQLFIDFSFLGIGWRGGYTESTWYVGNAGPIEVATGDRRVDSSGWNESLQRKPKYLEKTCAVPRCSP